MGQLCIMLINDTQLSHYEGKKARLALCKSLIFVSWGDFEESLLNKDETIVVLDKL